MTEAVQSNQLTDALDPARGWRRGAGNNLALADQMQFSSILRTLVDTPEQMMETAAGVAKPRETSERAEPTERDDYRAEHAERRRAQHDEIDGSERPYEPRADRPKEADASDAARDTTPEDVPAETAAPAAETAGAQTADAQAGKSFRDEVATAQEIVPAQNTGSSADQPADPAAQGTQTRGETDLAHAAQTQASGALTDRHFSRVGEDLHEAVTSQPARAGNHAGAQTAANSLKEEQASDLANRLGNVGPVQVQVDVANDTPKPRANPFHGLSAGVDFAGFEGLDTADPNLNGNLFKGDGTGTDAKTPSTHANVPADRVAAGTMPQDLANAFGQALRGAMMAGQHPSMQGADGKVQIAPSDVVQAIGATAPSGPSQVSQTAKANPTTAAHHPEKAQTAAEQIAVKIRQAVGEGADKITIKLNPHELGRVEVRLDMAKDGSISAVVLAERQETLDMLQKDARGLERALNDAGLRTDAASLSFGLRGDGQKNVDSGRDRRNQPQGRGDRTASRIELGDEASLGKTAGYGRALGAAGGVDIRV